MMTKIRSFRWAPIAAAAAMLALLSGCVVYPGGYYGGGRGYYHGGGEYWHGR